VATGASCGDGFRHVGHRACAADLAGLFRPQAPLATGARRLCIFAILALQVACGGGGSGMTSPPPPSTTPAPAGTYSVLVTGSAGGGIHNLKLTVIVQ
jgi:hypothetical protein